ncbi:hypothetical protein [Bradyrhizobium sp. I1.7.5]|uniref:hypothetical protein n=1 Tax=Bradyrhizobium sp. I1.7.5 TaxID=3156363 RepID=UPI003391D26D
MDESAGITAYEFREPDGDIEGGYRLFPAEPENNPNVFFHGTADTNRQLIIDGGFSQTDA